MLAWCMIKYWNTSLFIPLHLPDSCGYLILLVMSTETGFAISILINYFVKLAVIYFHTEGAVNEGPWLTGFYLLSEVNLMYVCVCVCFPADPCAADRPDYRVAIAVGVTLLVLIVIVVIAYLLGRKRRTDGYQSLWGRLGRDRSEVTSIINQNHWGCVFQGVKGHFH